MSKLTVKEENFARLYVEIGNASEAYRRAYDVSPTCKDETVWCNSSQLASKANVAQRIQELQDQSMVVHNTTMETLLNELEQARQLAMDVEKLNRKPQVGAAVSAINSKMKLLGLDKTTINHTSDDGTMSPNLDLDLTKLDDEEIDTLKHLLQKATR
jgi:phage terminase small subunit